MQNKVTDSLCKSNAEPDQHTLAARKSPAQAECCYPDQAKQRID